EHLGVVELGPDHLAVGSELDLPIHRHRHRPSPSFRRPDIERWQAMGKALSPRRSIALAGMASGLALRLKAAKGVTLRKIVEGGTDAYNQRRRMPDLRRSRGAATRACTDAVEFARHYAAYVGSPGCAVHAALSPGALRPARSRQIRRAQGALYHGAPRPRCVRRARRARS